ncbi:MAG: hypothetical protein KJO76_00820 [Gammaproteobacteria bacterium]|nr:hypothetical protein [Gammaproteobacteria bacterium]MBT8444174.1 hypothetical protein [Gammaproteobacteria bacterium]
MWMIWLLWLVVVFGGLFMGVGSARALLDGGFDLALALNAVVYLGCAAYGMPKLYRLVVKKDS